jgi:hypothetical protein
MKFRPAGHSQVPSLSFVVLQHQFPAAHIGQIKRQLAAVNLQPPLNLDKDASFLCPMNWLEQCRENLTYCLGGLVFNASQCRDYYNGHINREYDPMLIRQRGMGYEAEFLHLAMKHQPFEPNHYQKAVMTKYPEGVASIRPLLYDCRPYLDAQ